VLLPLVRHLKSPLPLVPASALGRCQLLYVLFLWWVVVGNFERALVHFTAQRLVTEGVIVLNAGLCTCLLLLTAPRHRAAPGDSDLDARAPLGRTVAVGLTAAAVAVLVDWGVVRALYGDRFAGHAGLHIRFGPHATVHRPDSPR
jgi:hypothetical protein